jgi:hypothetical protein
MAAAAGTSEGLTEVSSLKYSEKVKFICHRVNSLSDYPRKDFRGMEFDIRDSNGHILVTHDPYSTTGMELESFVIRLPKIDNFLYIVNVKSEGIEERAREILERNEITNFFFLDSSFPTIVKMSNAGEKRFAIRASEYETVQTAVQMMGKVDYVWIDCFTKFNPDHVMIAKHGCKYKVCLVSPELHNHSNYLSRIHSMVDDIKKNHVDIDYICCKPYTINFWKSAFDESE